MESTELQRVKSEKDSAHVASTTALEPSPENGYDSMTKQPELTFPEGGWRAWLTVIGGSMVMFCTFGAIQSFGIYQDYYTRNSLTEHPPSDISWIGSLQVCLLFMVGLPAGKLFDEGYFRVTLAVGSLVYLFSLFMLSLAKPHHFYQNLLAQGVGIGIGMGLLFLPSLSIVSHYFRARRVAAMGVVLAGSSIGGVIFPIMQNRIFQDAGGFPWGVRAAGFMSLALLLIANLIMRTRLPSRRERQDAYKPNIKAIVTDVPFMICGVGVFFVFWGLFFPFFYLQLFSVLHGVPADIAIYSISILNGASLFGRTIPNFIADKVGPLNVIIPMTYIAGALIFAMFGVRSTGGMVAFAILYGFFSGGFISLVAPMAATFATDVGEIGTRIGLMCFIIGFAVLTGTPIAGALLNPPAYSWYRPIIFNGVVVLSGTFIMTVARRMQAKRRGTSRI